MNVDHTKKLKHISLCTGYGGIDLGLSRALGAFRTVAYVEIEAFAIENLVSKIENELLDVAPIWTNLKTFPWKLYRGKVDILSGGFPCQPFSGAGRREGDEDPRHLFPYIINGLRELGRPPLVFFENVEGILSSNLKSDGWNDPEGTSVLLHVLRELERLGYDATAGIFSASEVGAPHQRKRVFIMGCRADLGESGRNLISSMLRDTESRRTVVEHAESLQNKRREPRSHESESAETREKVAVFLSCNTSCDRSETMEHITTAYPAPRGAEQYPCEPPRVTMDNSNNEGLQGQAASRLQRERVRFLTSRSGADGNIHKETQSSLGGDVDGFADRVDYAELYQSTDNRTDELRLLGNGVVPDTAERAFRELWRDLDT